MGFTFTRTFPVSLSFPTSVSPSPSHLEKKCSAFYILPKCLQLIHVNCFNVCPPKVLIVIIILEFALSYPILIGCEKYSKLIDQLGGLDVKIVCLRSRCGMGVMNSMQHDRGPNIFKFGQTFLSQYCKYFMISTNLIRNDFA